MGIWELVLVFAIVVLFFGATRLPALGEGLGKALRALKGAAGSAAKDEAPRKELPDRGDGPKGGGAPGP